MFSIGQKLWQNEFSRGGIFLTIGSFIGNFLNYFFNTLAARALGPSGYGELSALFSYTYITAVPITVLTTLLIQKISTSQNRIDKALAIERYFFSKLLSSWYLLIPLVMFIPFVPRITNLSLISAFSLVPITILSFITSYYTASLQAIRLFTALAVISIFATIIKLFGAVLVFWGLDGLTTIIIFLFISTFYIWFSGFRLLHRTKNTSSFGIERIDRRLRDIITSPYFIITLISLLAMTLLNNIDIIYMKKFSIASTAGLYSSWSLFAKIILYSVGPAISVLFVFYSSGDTKNHQHSTMKLSLFGLFAISVFTFVGYHLFAPFLVSIFFGTAYETVIPHLTKAALFGSFYSTIFYLNNYFLAKKSRLALILPVTIPFYLLLLLNTGGEILRVFDLNVFFSGAVVALYLGAYWIQTVKETTF